MTRRRFQMLMLLFVITAATYPAFAHAVLVSSFPQPNATVDGDNADVVLRYNSRIDAVRSSLALVAPDGHQQTLAADPHAAPNVLESKLPHLTKGSYTLRWQVLSTDGHITRGTLPFTVR